jgi:hypothetical protein
VEPEHGTHVMRGVPLKPAIIRSAMRHFSEIRKQLVIFFHRNSVVGVIVMGAATLIIKYTAHFNTRELLVFFII